MRALRPLIAAVTLALVLTAGCVAASPATAASACRSFQPGALPRVPCGGWNGFGVGRWPDARWRPYLPGSPFNRSARGAPVHPHSAEMVERVLAWSEPASLVAGAAGSSDDYAHPVYWSQPRDPRYTLHAPARWGRSPIEGMRIPVPARAQPAGGDDGHMTIVTPDGWEYDLWRARPLGSNGRRLTFSWGGRTRVDGDGLGSLGTASHFGGLAGIIRPEELAAGRIDHALFVVLRCTGGTSAFGPGVRRPRGGVDGGSFVYPAAGRGQRCWEGPERWMPPMGARFQLAMSDAAIAALPVPPWKKTILTALAHYGGYVGDTGGPGFGFMFQSGATYTSFGAVDPLVSFAQRSGVSESDGRYVFNMADDVPWERHLRVLLPPRR